jgi:hypothetical protein
MQPYAIAHHYVYSVIVKGNLSENRLACLPTDAVKTKIILNKVIE